MGKGTDHVGEGRCKFHGGSSSNIEAKNRKHGLYSKVQVAHPLLEEKVNQLRKDHDVFDLREEILKLRAIIDIMAEREDYHSVAKVVVDTSKVIERLHNIEVGRKFVISIENVSFMLEKAREIILRYIPDPQTRHMVAQEMLGLRFSSQTPKTIVGEVIEED